MKPPRIFRRRRRRSRWLRRRRGRGRYFATLMIRQLPGLLKLLFRLMRDPRIGTARKALFAAVAVYVFAPYDLIPDVLGPLGLVDDVYLIGLALHALLAAAGPDILLEHWDGDPGELGYLVEGVDQVGSVLPRRIRGALQGIVGLAGRR
jgi:uncharacterized membrane protein YkvA (DUF1232 family)